MGTETTETPWMAIIAVLTCLGTAIWALIKMYFLGQKHDEQMKELQANFVDLDKETSEDIKLHKEEMKRKVDQVYIEIKSTRDILIKVQTMCELLIADRIKKQE